MTSKEKLTEIEILKLNNVLLKIEYFTLQLNTLKQLKENLLATITQDHGFSSGAQIYLDGTDSRIEGEKIDDQRSDRKRP